MTRLGRALSRCLTVVVVVGLLLGLAAFPTYASDLETYRYDISAPMDATTTAFAVDLAVKPAETANDRLGHIYDVSANSHATNALRVATGLTTKSSARQALGQLGLTAEQLAAANRAIGRATTSSSIDVVQRGSDVIVRISRPGADGFQVFEHVVSPSGAKSVLQTAYDSAGNLVHFDPKTP